MKGALSDPDSVLYHAVNRALFPDTCYAFESGGHPRAIPQLTYESYLDTHARHYRLDNSYIVLYGNLDADRILGFLDPKTIFRCSSRAVMRRRTPLESRSRVWRSTKRFGWRPLPKTRVSDWPMSWARRARFRARAGMRHPS